MGHTVFFVCKVNQGVILFSCKFCKISKNTFFTEHLWVIASEKPLVYLRLWEIFMVGLLVKTILTAKSHEQLTYFLPYCSPWRIVNDFFSFEEEMFRSEDI